jgi:hypothetical protein
MAKTSGPTTDGVVADLDMLIQAVGEQLSAAVVSDEQSERLAAPALSAKLDALTSARNVVAGSDTGLVVST